MMANATALAIRPFCSVVMAMALVAAVVVAMVFPASALAVEMARASPTGDAWTAWAESPTERAVAVEVTPRRCSSDCSFSKARFTRMGGVCAASHGFADFAEVVLLEKTLQDGFAILVAQLIDGFVEQRSDLGAIGFGVFQECIHFDGLPFAGLTTALATHGFCRHKTSVAMQPTA